MSIFKALEISKNSKKKQFAVLIDPDKIDSEHLDKLIHHAELAKVDYFFVGGSYLSNHYIKELIPIIKQKSKIPVILFPGDPSQIVPSADAILFLSLVSGRNPDFLIGKQVIAAPILKQLSIDVISTAYLLIDSGKATTASYISNTQALPNDKPELVAYTAYAANLIGMKTIYLDAGSGAIAPIPVEIIEKTREICDAPIIVGGGIRTTAQAKNAINAGADVVVVGNAIEEKNWNLMHSISETIHNFS